MEPSTNAIGKEEACSLAMSIASGSVPFMVLKAVIELDVLEIIKKAGAGAKLSPAQITAQLPSKNPEATASMLDRILRVLASHSILSFSLREDNHGRVERLYGLAPPSEFFTKDENGGALASMSLFLNDKTFMESWYHLKDAVLDGGIPFNKAYGMAAFEYLGKDARFNDVFNNAMADYAPITINKLLENYKGFQDLSSLVDVGGNIGTTLSAIISKNPTIKGINFDLPHVIQDAPPYNDIEHIMGDMFVSVPKGDAIFMKRILHDWSDEHCIRLLKNCYTALPDHGKVIACEYILPVAPETSHSAKMVFQFDAVMLAFCIGGKERTELEFEVMAKEAGFKDFRLASSAYDMKVMEFLKN